MAQVYEESVYQEAVPSETALTPQDQLRLQWQQQPGAIPFIRQKNVIDQNAELLPYAATASLRGWQTPALFALQGLVLIAVIASLLNWQFTRHAGMLEDEITTLQATVQTETQRQEEIIAATQAEIRRISSSSKPSFKLHLSDVPLTRDQALTELNSALEESKNSEEQYKAKMAAREHRLRAKQSALALVNSGSPLIFSLALILAAALVGRNAQKIFARNNRARRLGDFYLYFATSEGLWPNLVFVAFLHIAFSGSTYGLGSMFSSVGPLFWVFFWIGFYFLLLRYFVMVSRDIYSAVQARPPLNEWGLDNKVLFRIHNSFVVTFVAMEAAFLGLCYALYLAQKL
jgi:hypothetical protein